MTVRLESWYVPERDGAGWFRLRLVNAGPRRLADFRVAFQSVVQLDPPPGISLLERVSGHHVFGPPAGIALAPGAVWEIGLARCGHRPGHANDGPVGAYLDPGAAPVRTAVTGRARAVVGETSAIALAPPVDAGTTTGAAWAVAAACERRVIGPATPVLGGGDVPVSLVVEPALGERLRVAERDGAHVVAAGTPTGLVAALLRLARCARTGIDPLGVAAPRWGWRGLHVDLARQFFPSADVLDLLDVAAWHGLNRLHLHLTDDEAWRLPIEGYPALTETGGFRGPGRAVPPLLGSGPHVYGGVYSPAEMATWVARATALGVDLVPEIDLPGHCFAACAALPELVDPAATTRAPSVQHFVGNVLDPGLPATWRFLDAVLGTVADHFPGPWLHLGGDEVPAGAWSQSPAALAWVGGRGGRGPDDVGRAFTTEVLALARSTTGRTLGVWEEAAVSGALAPGEGYVVGWRPGPDMRHLAAAGYDVVASPADSCYLDMAAGADWHEPGTSWAGPTTVEDVAAFDPGAGWSASETERLLGVQAAIWTEHVPDRPALDRMLHPRLDVLAASWWS